MGGKMAVDGFNRLDTMKEKIINWKTCQKKIFRQKQRKKYGR